MRRYLLATIVLAGLAACAATPSNRTLVRGNAPRVSEFRFDQSAPLTAASEFAPWAALTASNEAEHDVLDPCIADRDACATRSLERFSRLLELAADLPPVDQVKLVQEYFNRVDQIMPEPGAPDRWASLYHVAATNEGDCKAIALGKYFTLRRLGFSPDDLRVVMNWDDRERDWHALLAVRLDGDTYILDSILGLQPPRAYSDAFMVYSISEDGVWDHAPDFVPIP